MALNDPKVGGWLRERMESRNDTEPPYNGPWDRVKLEPVIAALRMSGLAFNKNRVDEAINQFNRILKEKKQGKISFNSLDINGIKRTSWAQATTSRNFGDPYNLEWRLVLSFNPIQSLGDDRSKRDFGEAWQCPITIRNEFCMAGECCTVEEIDQKAKQWQEEWDKSDCCKKLVDHLKANKKNMEEVNKVIAFACGCIGRRDLTMSWDDERCQILASISYKQHPAAKTIRDTLNPEAKIYAQDPAYCATGKKYLKERLGIEVVENADGIAKLDKHTFALSVNATFPIGQILTDYLYEHGGPAGILYNKIGGDDMLLYEDKLFPQDPAWRRAFMIGGEIDDYSADASSPWLVEYKNENCITVGLDDKESLQMAVFWSTELYLKKKDVEESRKLALQWPQQSPPKETVRPQNSGQGAKNPGKKK